MDSDVQRSTNGNVSALTELFSAERPFTIASGVICASPPVLARVALDVDEIGFLTTKTLSLNPRPGYTEPIIHEYHPGCFINAVGLANPGAGNFVETIKPLLPLYNNKSLMVSIMGSDPEEFLNCALVLDDIADAFELNLSCPHVKSGGLAVGADLEMVEKIVRLLVQRLQKPIVPKLSPNVPSIGEFATCCERAGASALSLINTVGPGTAVDDDGNPILSNVVGGISGAAIKPIGLKLVREVSSQVKLPIIASGGIGSPQDVNAYRKAGASYFAVGSSLAGMTTLQIKQFFKWLGSPISTPKPGNLAGIARSSNRLTTYSGARVISNRKIAPNMFRLELDSGTKCNAGQFFFLRLPGIGEKPFSPMMDSPAVYLIRPVGPFTEKLSTLKEGSEIYFRGPYGNGFKAPEGQNGIIVLGGGTGVAPILMGATKWKKNIVQAFLGFSQPLSEFFQLEIESILPNAKISVDLPGEPGEVLRLAQREIGAYKEDFRGFNVYICGPLTMMQKAGEFFSRFVGSNEVYIAREDVMKCGIGLCGSCGTENGLRSCIDGPVVPFSN